MFPPDNKDDMPKFIDSVDRYYRLAEQAYTEDNLFYEGKLESLVKVPQGFFKNIPTTGRAIIDEAVDNVEPYDIRINYPPRGKSEQAHKDAETVSRMLISMWNLWRITNSDIDVLRDFIKNLFKHGKAIFKIVPDYTLWPELDDDDVKDLKKKGILDQRIKEIKNIRRQNFPLVCRSISPTHIMEDPSVDSRKLWVVEKYNATTSDIRRRFAKYIPTIDTWDDEHYIVYEVWTATYSDEKGKTHFGKHWIYINNDTVLEEDNDYGFLPYIIKYSGFGADNQDGHAESKSVGFFTIQVKSMLAAEMRRFTHFDALLQQLAFPIIFLPTEIEDLNVDVAPGGINYVPLDVMAVTNKIFVKADLPDAEYMQSINLIQSQVERATTQRALRGAGVPGTDSAAQLQMVTAQAKLRIEPVKKVVEEAVDQCNSMALQYIAEVLEDSVSIFAVEKETIPEYKVKPQMIIGRYRTKTTFMPSEEQVKERKLLVASEAMAKAQLNPYDAYKMAGFEDAMEIVERNLAFEMMQDPAVRRQIAKRALEEWGYDSMELTIESAADDMMVQQMLAALQQSLMGQQPPGVPTAGEQVPTEPQQGGGGGATLPQAVGAPVQGMQTPPDLSGMMQGGGVV